MDSDSLKKAIKKLNEDSNYEMNLSTKSGIEWNEQAIPLTDIRALIAYDELEDTEVEYLKSVKDSGPSFQQDSILSFPKKENSN